MTTNNSLTLLVQSYPVFEPNQVLTDKQLNGIVQFLEQQDRLTRFCAIGMGIICGFEASWEEADDSGTSRLHLTEGCGITSEGYLIKSPGCLLPNYREAKIPPAWFGLDPLMFPPNFEGIFELVPAPQVADNEIFELQRSDVAGKVLALVLECKQDDNAELCHNDCDERGNDANFIVHKLLISKDLAEIRQHRVAHRRVERRGGVVVEVDRPHARSLPRREMSVERGNVRHSVLPASCRQRELPRFLLT